MDPDANLSEQRRIIARMLDGTSEAIDTGDAVRLAELARALDEWITRYGFLPAEWITGADDDAPHGCAPTREACQKEGDAPNETPCSCACHGSEP